MKRHILDRVDESEIFHAFEWDMRVWKIKAGPISPVLLVKPGELEQALRDNFDNGTDGMEDWILVKFGTVNDADLPIKDFEGF